MEHNGNNEIPVPEQVIADEISESDDDEMPRIDDDEIHMILRRLGMSLAIPTPPSRDIIDMYIPPYIQIDIPGMIPRRQLLSRRLPRIQYPKQGIPRGASILSTTRSNEGKVSITITYDEHCYMCCVCFEYIVGTIINCDNGHALCNTCDNEIMKSSNYKCPVCKSVTRMNNSVLENGLKNILIKCPYSVNGCMQSIYPEDTDEHIPTCVYSDIKCPWCETNTSPYNFQSHAETECKYPFRSMGCSKNINFINSDSINYKILVSSLEPSRTLYIAKFDNMCHLLCIQTSNIDEQLDHITITFSTDPKSFPRKHTIRSIPVNKPYGLTTMGFNIVKIPMNELHTYDIIEITDFSDKLYVGCHFMLSDINGEWHRATVIRRTYNDIITCTYTVNNRLEYDSIVLHNGTSRRIRPADYNDGRTTAEDNIYINNLSMPEQYELALERSMHGV
jgi:hypothetical protein